MTAHRTKERISTRSKKGMNQILGGDEKSDICDTCAESSYCSQLRLALAILGTSLESSLNKETGQRYQEILEQLSQAGWNYPSTHHLCQLSGQKEQILELTDELIKLAKKGMPEAIPMATAQHVSASIPANIPSLYEEETSYE
jgi:hypothetical protein